MIPKMTDSRGRESATLGFITPAFWTLLVKFAAAGMTLPYVGSMPPMTASEFGAGMACVLGIWLGREWTEKRTGSGA